MNGHGKGRLAIAGRLGAAAAAALLVVFGLAVPVSALGSTSTTLGSSQNPSTVGQSVTFTAMVTGSSPTGTVDFFDNGSAITNCTGVALASGSASCMTTTLTAGANQPITATYNGDGNNAGSTSNTVSQTVNAALGSTSTVVVTSGSPSTVGQSVTFTATVTGSNLAGTVAFTDNGSAITNCAGVALNGSDKAACTTTALPVGNGQTITAAYSNDPNNTGSNGTVSQTVNALTTSTALGSSLNPSTVGQSVTFTATVTGGSSPTGTVAFTGGGITTCASQALNGSGVATCSTTALSAGTNQTITAVYSGNANNATSTGTVSQTVNTPVVASPTSTTLTSSPNPSTFGQSVSLTATVTRVGGGTPTGTVEFFDGTTLLGTFTLGGSGLSSSALAPNQAGLSTSALSQGTHSITAVYSGDSLDNPSTSSPLTQVVNPQAPNLPATTTTLTPAANPSVVDHPEKLTATVTTTSPGGSITGSVQFFEGNILLGTVPLAGNQAVVDVEAKVAGTYVLTASYSGDGANAPSTSGALNQVMLGLGQAGLYGYWLVGSDGGIFTFGSAQFYGSTGALTLQRPVVGITPTSDLGGYWLVASDGGIFTFGDAGFFGSIPGLGFAPAGTGAAKQLNAPIVGMVPSSDGGGYFMVGSDGGVFAFGDAKFEGSCPGIGGCSGAAVTVMPDATGNGYWLVTATGHIYTFGDAAYYGAPGPQSVPVTSAVRTADGKGYWILFSNGAIAGYGDAGNFGSPGGVFGGSNPATAIFSTADGQGYWVASANGSVYSYGDAQFEGSMAGTKLNGPIVAATGF